MNKNPFITDGVAYGKETQMLMASLSTAESVYALAQQQDQTNKAIINIVKEQQGANKLQKESNLLLKE